MGTENQFGVQLNLSAMPTMIADRIYLNLDSSFSAAARSLLNNGSVERGIPLVDDYNGNVHSQNFFTFGLSTIQFPIDKIIDLTSQKLVSKTLERFVLDNTDAPQNIAEKTRNLLHDVMISEDYILGNKNIFDGKDIDKYETTIKKAADNIEMRATTLKNNILSEVRQMVVMFEETFRDVGIIKHYDNRLADVNGMAQKIKEIVEQKINELITGIGLSYSIQIVTRMHGQTEIMKKEYLEKIALCKKREKNLQEKTIPKYERDMSKAENKLLFKEKRKREALRNYLDAYKSYAEAKIGWRAYNMGNALLEIILKNLETLKGGLQDSVIAIKRIIGEFEDDSNKWEHFFLSKITDVSEFNGAILFDERKVDELLNRLDINDAISYLQGEIFNEWGGVLKIAAAPFDILQFGDEMRKAASVWIQTKSNERIYEADVVKELMGKYPDPTKRKKFLEDNSRKAHSFLKFNRVQEQMLQGSSGGYTPSETTIARKAAILDDEEGKRADISKVKEELLNASNIISDDVKHIDNKNEIYIMEERTAFPLRLIEQLEPLRDRYKEYTKMAHYIPVHILSIFSPSLIPLFLTDQKEKEKEEVFILARVMDTIRFEKNRIEERDEVRFRFNEFGTDTYEALGWDMQEAIIAFREKTDLTEKCQKVVGNALKNLKSYKDRAELGDKLDTFLNEIKGTYKFGDEDPEYKHYKNVVIKIKKKHDLGRREEYR